MAKYMDVHHGMKGVTAEQVKAAHEADLAIEKDEGVHFERAWADPESGTVYCLSEAPSAEAVQRIHERAGHKADEVHPVPIIV
ncbi:SCO4226 family nickel-binding protein [Streptomyces sp. MUM 178J]|uniref:SCO4226 family nickel-binding protein n=1 Tax=Streptomyces sp. MUM 178J TaxID=2791991 RepID=UPI001F04B931|nr:SCO4226 family nickel-binding protein [Streptomyces sp. MUM 178J]WRQ78142.1 SCO4226 family nickel-binding protein [Streptomyces sp. MUM 178J]